MSTRERHAHVLRMAVVEAVANLHRVWDGRGRMQPTEFKTAEQAACDRVGTTLSDLEDFAGMSDADAELEFDGAPDTQEQVTTPPEVYAR